MMMLVSAAQLSYTSARTLITHNSTKLYYCYYCNTRKIINSYNIKLDL